MPIYAYRCDDCGHAKDVLQKVSDPLLTVCPSCGEASFRKQVTAAGFQLKGSGWYVTDFRGGSGAAQADAKPADAAGDSAKSDAAKSDGAKGDAAKTDGAKGDGAKTGKVPAAAAAGAGEGASSSGGCGASCACH